MRKIVAEHYNDDRKVRIQVFERENGACSYFFEYRVTWPEHPVTDSWEEYLPSTSGVYDSIAHALDTAQSDPVWVHRQFPG